MEPLGQLPVAAAAAATDAPEAAIARTQTFFVFITGADAGDQESVCFCTEERDWANLLPDLFSKVAKFALRSDVVDYIRLRAVCKPWRSVAKADPKLMGMDPRCFPRNWDILKQDVRDGKTRFVNNLTGASIWLQIPAEYGEVIASAEGCLILGSHRGCTCTATQKPRLFNPVTRAVADLPVIPCGAEVNSAGFVYDDDGEEADGEADADADLTLVLCSLDHVADTKRIVYARPGDAQWHMVRILDMEHGELVAYSEGGLSVRGTFYVPTPTGNVRKVELRPYPRLVHAARQEARYTLSNLRYFDVASSLELDGDDDGGTMLLLRYIADNVEVFKVSFKDGKGSLTLVEVPDDIIDGLLPWLTLAPQ